MMHMMHGRNGRYGYDDVTQGGYRFYFEICNLLSIEKCEGMMYNIENKLNDK